MLTSARNPRYVLPDVMGDDMFREFSTNNSDTRDTIGSWRAAVAETLVDVDCALTRANEFNGAFAVFSAGEFGLAKLQSSRHTATRAPESSDKVDRLLATLSLPSKSCL